MRGVARWLERALVLWLALAVGSVRAQQPELRVAAAPRTTVQLGRTVRIPIELLNPLRGARLEAPAEVDGLQMQVAGPQQSSQTTIIQGRVREKRAFLWELRVRPTREGVFRVPAIRVFDGTAWHESQPFEIEAAKDLEAADLVRVVGAQLPEWVYVRQPIDVQLDIEILESLPLGSDRFQRIRYPMVFVDAPWLDEGDGLHVLPSAGNGSDGPQIPINLRLDVVGLDRVEREGRWFRRFRVRRRLLPTSAGTRVLSAPTVRVSSGENARVGRFGEVVPSAANEYFGYGEDQTIEVRPLPEEGRPDDYLGAVGRFSVAAKADRAAVRVGESVRLTLVVEGEGNTAYLDLPERLELDGFHFLGRTEPERSAARAFVTYDLRVIDAAVKALPALPFSWFDPAAERYVTATTDPWPLRVDPGAETGVLEAEVEAAEAFESDIADIRVLRAPPSLPSPPLTRNGADSRRSLWVTLGIALPWLLAAFGMLWFRRRAKRDRDPLERRAREARGAFERRLREGVEPAQALAEFVAAQMRWPDAAVVAPDLAARLQDAGVDAGIAARAQGIVESLSAARYGGAGAAISVADVRDVVDGFRIGGLPTGGVTRRRSGPCCWLVAALAASATARAQSMEVQAPKGEAAAAFRAYRDGEFEAARAGWRAWLVEHPRHGEAWFNLGNACYRAGDYARARWAYESALRLLPRDAELRANRDLTVDRLGSVAGPSSFADGLDELRRNLTTAEWQYLAVGLQVLTAALLLLGWGRRGMRLAGWVLLAPAAIAACEVLWWGPGRLDEAVLLERARVYSEPNGDLDPIHRFERGVRVEVLPAGDAAAAWQQVRFGDGRRGYVSRDALAVVGVVSAP